MRAARFVLTSLALAASSLGAQAVTKDATEGAIAFIDVTVIPMDRERVLTGQTVVVENGRIASVGPAGSARFPASARRIDGRGRYLLPGLAEMHAHVPPGNAPPEQLVQDIMFLYVANGVTTIRGMLGAPYQLGLRGRLARGEILGPSFIVGAPSLNGNTATTAAQGDSLVRAHKAAGYDFVKVHPGVTLPAWDAAVRAARAVGITLAGHVPADVGVERAIRDRMSSIDHLDGYLFAQFPEGTVAREVRGITPSGAIVEAMDERRFAELARRARDNGVWNVPTMYLWENFFSQDAPETLAALPEMRYATRQWLTGWINQKRGSLDGNRQQGLTPELAARYVQLRRRLLKTLADEGAPLLMGTDSPQMFNVPGFALHREIGIMRASGLTPYQVLESGTRNVARFSRERLGLPGDFGTVAVGQRADLVLLDANPLDDLANLSRRAGVMVRGRWVSAAEIARGLEEIAARNRE